jgi:cell division septation protein DedD
MVRLAGVAVGLVLSTSPLYAQETLFTVTVSFANIHAGPSTDSRIIATTPPGTSFEVTRELGSWVAIAWPAARDGVGYLHSSWGRFSRGADAPLTGPPPSPIQAQAQPAAAVPDAAVPDTQVTAPSSSSVRAGESRVAELSGRSTVPNSESARPPGYSVQVAAVRDLEEARTLSDQLTRAGYSVYLTTATVNQVRFHRVRVGPFQTRQTAQQVAQRLETQGHQAPWITK